MELLLYTVLERLRHVDIAGLAKLCAEVRITCSAFNPKQKFQYLIKYSHK